MHTKTILRTIGVPALAVALGFCAGSLHRDRVDHLKYEPELDSVRAEQQRVNDEYRELTNNLAYNFDTGGALGGRSVTLLLTAN
jgi:hypothetical protein